MPSLPKVTPLTRSAYLEMWTTAARERAWSLTDVIRRVHIMGGTFEDTAHVINQLWELTPIPRKRPVPWDRPVKRKGV